MVWARALMLARLAPAPVLAITVSVPGGMPVRLLAWVRVSGIDSLADSDDPGNCISTARRITLEMGTARCIPFGTVGQGPSCDQWTVAALKMDADQAAMEAAICCANEAFQDLSFEPRTVPGTYQPFGPDGNCLSGTMDLTIDYDCGCSLDGS